MQFRCRFNLGLWKGLSGESERLGFTVHLTAATFHRPGELSNDLGFLGAEANLIFLLLSNSEAHVLVR